MAGELFVSALPGEIRAALLSDETVEELLVLRDGAAPQAGDLFLARVQRFDKGLDGAFVELGLARPGLLPRRELPRDMQDKLPAEGTALAVRVLRAPGADKGARVSARGLPVDAARLQGLKAPARLPVGGGPLAALLRQREPQRVVCDDAALLRRLKDSADNAAIAFDLHSAPVPLFEAAGLEAEIDALLAPRVDLPQGGFLLIEPGQTLTAIDVNAGRHDGRGGAAAQAREVNLAALPEIARHLRLRALAGLIVVDFLEMKQSEDRKAVAAALRRAVAGDPEPCQVFGVSPSGLLEMTRRRGRAPLHELLCRPCGLHGSGREKSPETLAYEALRQTAAGALGKVVTGITLRVAPAVEAALKGEQAAALAAVERRLGRSVGIVSDPLVQAYELVLG
ncbi:MAG: ribonuclease E/G [Kiloniellaceae bacterium]